jgi:two-component system, OmpR family, copper resistance phosphate regulon response regulator CusR
VRVLVIEDDKPVCRFLQKGLQAESYAVDIALDGTQAQGMVEHHNYDLVILDLNLPGMDGLDVLKHIRAKKNSVPVLILSSRNQVEDRVRGLDLGADDYLPKPFAFSELAARTRCLLRRSSRPLETEVRIDDLELKRVERTVKRAGRLIDLSPKEFALLEYLLRNSGRTVTRTMIIEHVWNLSFDTMTNVVDVYVSYLRKKIDDGYERKLIHTIRGVGYRLGPVRSGEE